MTTEQATAESDPKGYMFTIIYTYELSDRSDYLSCGIVNQDERTFPATATS